MRWAICIARPHLILYTFGWWYLGGMWASHDLLFGYRLSALPLSICAVLALFFVHALNDAFDSETDSHNPRKHTYEQAAVAEERTRLLFASAAVLSVILLVSSLYSPVMLGLAAVWAALVFTYNVPPLRFKKVPFLDLLFPSNFFLWGIMGYVYAAHTWPPLAVMGAGALFVAIMHLYSAVIDREYDQAAGIITTAVALGAAWSLGACVAGMFLLSVLVAVYAYYTVAVSLALYVIFFIVYARFSNRYTSDGWYARFIVLHYVCGAIVFWSLL